MGRRHEPRGSRIEPRKQFERLGLRLNCVNPTARGVVTGKHAWGPDGASGFGNCATQQRFEVLDRNPTVAQDLGRFDGHVEDCRLDTYDAAAAIDDEIDVVTKVIGHVLGARRADASESVCTWCGDRRSEQIDKVAEECLRRYSYDNGVATTRHRWWDPLGALHQDRDWAWPRMLSKVTRTLRYLDCDLIEHRVGRTVHDERVGVWSVLDLEDATNSVPRVDRCTEPIHRLGWQGDDAAVSQYFCATTEGVGIEM